MILEPKDLKDHFRCSHLGGNNICRRYLKGCKKEKCQEYGSCGACRNCYVPSEEDP